MNKFVTRQDMPQAKQLKAIMDRYASGEVLGAIALYLQEFVDDIPVKDAHPNIGHTVLMAKEDVLRLELGYD